MQITTSIVIQALLLGLALLVIILRAWARLCFEKASLTISEYFTWLGWFFTLGWFICSTIALQTLIKHPAVGAELVVNNVAYLKTVFIAEYFFDIGIYWSKLSITTFYWFLIPDIFQSLRKALYVIATYLVCALVASILTNTLITQPISNNWQVDLDGYLRSELMVLPGPSSTNLSPLGTLTQPFASSGLLTFLLICYVLFCFPFFIFQHLTLRKEQIFGLVGVFSLGAITLIVSLARFVAYNVTDFGLDDAVGNTLCTAEMTTAVIVVCLPGLKKFIVRSKSSTNTPNHDTTPTQSGSGQSSNNHRFKPQIQPHPYAAWGVRDDEIELVSSARRSSPPDTETLNDQELMR
ncbi:hypothetical protein KAF25_006878 [Fusarium avenaceum]|uniref:Rhodopsin domain-containing protein n=1 Tax=Fusarium avenaceum TaxID=40199 RepID=A0A9P7GXW7_9HYPO|nr:hypothetical protein KAF25_006878 [Fusarium avenaceum]